MVTDVLAVALGNKASFQWTSRDVDVVNRGRWWSRSNGPMTHLCLDDSTLLFWRQAVDGNFTIDVLLVETVKLRCNGCLDVILGVLAEVIFIEVLKLDGLLDDVLLKLFLLLVDVGSYLKYATVYRDVHEVLTKKFLKFIFMLDVNDVGCFW